VEPPLASVAGTVTQQRRRPAGSGEAELVIASSSGGGPDRPSAEVGPRSAGRAVGLVAVAALLIVSLTGCTWEEAWRFGWPEGISPQAENMRDLWIGSTVAALAVGVFVWGLIFWAAIRYRKKGDELPLQTRYNLPIEVLYTVVPFLIVAVLFYYTAISQTYIEQKSARPDVTVSVVAFKWNWKFAYPEERGQGDPAVETVGSTNEVPILVVPTDRSIRFVETSEDVIHSFWVPDILFKRDVIPGRQNQFEITVTEPGAYVGRCAELCGTYHSNMNFEMRAVSAADYDRWIEAKKAGMTTAEALAEIGEEPLATTTHPFNPDRTARTPS
jgi:cytochrome c oxidase subunit II